MCPSALCVHGACLRSSSAFLSTVFGLFKNKGKTAAACKAQKQKLKEVKLKGKDLFWDKAVGLS